MRYRSLELNSFQPNSACYFVIVADQSKLNMVLVSVPNFRLSLS